MPGPMDPFDPSSLGLATHGVAKPAAATAESTVTNLARTALAQPDRPLWHPDNPLLWFGVLLGVTVGLIGVTVSGRAGPLKASVSAGKS